ncbi:hypothetical protein LEP1GSC040_3492 [Leptospira santarosai str. 2000030832]|nr:hypothetical protein LEP1GSC040_3492 [Leptospira santarosai str. 2000030832]
MSFEVFGLEDYNRNSIQKKLFSEIGFSRLMGADIKSKNNDLKIKSLYKIVVLRNHQTKSPLYKSILS